MSLIEIEPPAAPKAAKLKIVGIGASAGGLEAFTEFVRNLPTGGDLAYVLVQHLDPTHRSLLTELLGREASLPVQEILHQTPVAPNHIYVIPPNCDLAIKHGVLLLSPRDIKAAPSRTIDHFLKSLAADQGVNAIGVILSGAGSDGTKGLKAIKDAGGLTFAQDEGSSKYDSMPRSAIAAECVDFVLPPQKIAAEIARLGESPARQKNRAAANARNRRGVVSRKQTYGPAPVVAADWPKAPGDKTLRNIFLLLRSATGIDFNLYRINTVRRRLTRRLAVHKLKDLEKYLRLLRDNPVEVEALHQDLLIGVTSFFRNPSVFETLKRRVFPKLVKNLPHGETLRFWVAGCSTGQEAYTYAMAFLEYADKLPMRPPVQIFATDVNLRPLEFARAAVYSKPQLAGLSVARINRFLHREGDTYRVQKPLRDMVIFAQQNLLTDPPFTRVDLISCRNMLIYIEPALQQRIIPNFHYALKPDGVLVLGSSESIGSFANSFTAVSKNQKIYQKKGGGLRRGERPHLPPVALPPVALPPPRRVAEPAPSDIYREADRLILAKFSPAAVLVNESADILHFRGKVQPFLALPSGKASLNLLKLARDAVILPLQRLLRRAQRENRAVREKVPSAEPRRESIVIEVQPFHHAQSRCFLVVFEQATVPPPKAAARGARTAATPADRRKLGALRRELVETREHLDNVREQHETAMEELQASNEEVQSSNEELQSLNEELETSNEELESANEELTTLNEELATRNTELRESEQRLREQADLVELAPLLARSTKDRIIFWNRGAEQLYGFTKEEALGQTSHLLLRAHYSEPLEKIQARLMKEGRWEGEVLHRRKDGTELWVAAQWVVHYDDQKRVRAVLEINTDISLRRRAERSLRDAEELNNRILESTPDCILVLDLAGRLLFANAGAQQSPGDGGLAADKGMHWTSLWLGDSRAEAEAAGRTALAGELARFQALAAGTEAPGRWWDVLIRPITDAAGRPERLLAVCRDITEQRLSEETALKEARLATLRAEVAVEVARGGELVPILQQLAQTLLQHTGAAHVRIWLSDGGATLRLQASAGLLASPNAQQAQLTIGEGCIGAIAATKQSYVTHQVAGEAEICDPAWARREGITSFVGHPLVFESRTLGVVGVLLREKPEPRVLREISLSADAIALLVQRKHADEEHNRLLCEAMEARNTAMAASRAKDEFLAALSHELRTPLNPVLLLASDGAENPEVPAAIRATFETIRNNISLEAKLIDDLLDLTRIAHGKLTFDLKPLDLHQVLADAVRIVSATVENRPGPIALELQAARSTVAGDPVRLQQVFWNLLINAVKFTPVGGTITVRTSLKDRFIVIEVRDTGIGMRESDIGRIFDPFSQVERRRGGLGLGLAISRQLLEKHHGSIRAVSEGPGKGSTFIVELPLSDGRAPDRDAATEIRNPTSRRGANGQRPRLLLVEDHASTRNTLAELLGRRHFDVVTAATVNEARERFRQGRFRLVISDLGLPDGDGYSLLAELRTRQPDLISIALSGYGTEEDHSRSRAAGFAHHLTKPVSMSALDEIIDGVLAGGLGTPVVPAVPATG